MIEGAGGMVAGEAFSSSRSALVAPLVSSRDEMNLAEFPLAVLSTRVSAETKTLEFCDTVRLKNGQLLERRWIITGTDKFGLPTSTDDDVVLGLLCLSMDQGFRQRKVYFTRYELMKVLRWAPEGRNYSRIERSLDRLSGVRIKAANSFFDNASKSFQTRNFGIIDEYKINGKRKAPSGDDEPQSYFVWSEIIFNSFKVGFIKKLDLDFYFSLKSAVSRRLYRYLDKHFYHKSVIEKPLMLLAFEKLGLSRNYRYLSSVKQQIEPAADELVARGFLASYEVFGRGEGAVVRFTSGKPCGSAKLGASFVPPLLQSGSDDQLKMIEALVARGLLRKQTERLLAGRSAEEQQQIWKVIAYYDFLIEKGDAAALRNRVGFLYRAVESPAKFLPVDGPSSKERKPKPVPPDDQRKRYADFVEHRLAETGSALPAGEFQAIQAAVEKKLRCLRAVLDESRFHEAVRGCVRDELKKRSSIPPLEEWAKRAAA